jgi:dihydrolipoamide dehydrogenase
MEQKELQNILNTHKNRKSFDLVVIGAGPAGYAAAMRALDFGKSVCLIEKDKLGGAGIFHGALSSKTLWEISQRVAEINDIQSQSIRCTLDLTWQEILQTVDASKDERYKQYQYNAQALEEKLGKENLCVKQGRGYILSKNQVAIYQGDVLEEVVDAQYILIATGSKPRYLPNIQVDEKTILTSDGIENLSDYPRSMVIVGAGVVGCEFATIFSNFGKTKVYIIDRAPRILPFEDSDISDFVAEKLEEKNVTIHHNAQLLRLEKKGDGVEYEISYPDGRTEVMQVEKALLSIGRNPVVEGIGRENLSLELSKTGCMKDFDTQTGVDNVYVAGDVSGRIALVNVGEIEARHAVERMFGDAQKALSYDNICSIMFLNPEVAAVGMNEQQCEERGIPIKVVKIDYSLIPRAIAMRKTQGFFKIIVTHDKAMKILGMRAVGEHASSAIQAIGLLIKMDKGIIDLSELIHPHPSIIEGIQECVRALLGTATFKPSVYAEKIQCYANASGVKTPLQNL